MATPFDRLMNTIRPHLPGAIDDAIRQELFMVCREFFAKSSAWRETLEFTPEAGEKEAFVMPFAGKIERLISVEIGGRDVRGATFLPPDTVVMPFEGDGSKEYNATFAMTVSDPITRDAYPIAPDYLVERYTQTLIHGILMNMMAQPSKPYTNPAMAQFHMRKFNGGWQRALNDTKTGNTVGSQRWRFPRTFMTR